MKTLLLLLTLLLLTSAVHADVPKHRYTLKYFIKQHRKAVAKRQVKPHKVRPAYRQDRGLKSLITF